MLFSPTLWAASSINENSKGIAADIAKQYANSVVEIEMHVKYPNDSEEGHLGAGVFIEDGGYVLSVSHLAYDEADLKKNLNIDEDEGGSNEDILSSLFSAPRKSKVYTYWVTYKNHKYRARLVGSNPYVDAALFKVDAKIKDSFIPAPMGDSDKLQVGESVVAIGSPVGLTNSVTGGLVSAMHRRGDDILWFAEDFIQTDTPINPGNSGGPVINARGEVVGIADAGITGADGLNFAVPINLAKDSLARMKKEGRIKCGWFGAKVLGKNFARTGGFEDMAKIHELTDIDDRTVIWQLTDVSDKYSAIVSRVDDNSPAQKAGVKRGDIVIEFNGKEILEGFDLKLAISQTKVDQEVSFKVMRIEDNKKKIFIMKARLLDKVQAQKKP